MKQLQALDASIEKWQRVVYSRSFEERCPLCDYHRPTGSISANCSRCIIGITTKNTSCRSTAYYETSIFNCISKKSRINDNLMLSRLYEIRLEYINGYHKGIYE